MPLRSCIEQARPLQRDAQRWRQAAGEAGQFAAAVAVGMLDAEIAKALAMLRQRRQQRSDAVDGIEAFQPCDQVQRLAREDQRVPARRCRQRAGMRGIVEDELGVATGFAGTGIAGESGIARGLLQLLHALALEAGSAQREAAAQRRCDGRVQYVAPAAAV